MEFIEGGTIRLQLQPVCGIKLCELGRLDAPEPVKLRIRNRSLGFGSGLLMFHRFRQFNEVPFVAVPLTIIRKFSVARLVLLSVGFRTGVQRIS